MFADSLINSLFKWLTISICIFKFPVSCILDLSGRKDNVHLLSAYSEDLTPAVRFTKIAALSGIRG